MKKAVTLLLVALLSACSAPRAELPLERIAGLTIKPLGPVPLAEPLAIAPGGRLLAWAGPQLNLHGLPDQRFLSLSKDIPDALSWSPDGRILVSTFPNAGGSRLVVFDSAGHKLNEIMLDGRIRHLMWSDHGQLMAGMIQVKSYSFGTHLTACLISWDKRWLETRQLLYETTLIPATMKILGARLLQTFSTDLSPLQDELLYTRVYAPPAFAASRQLVLRHLETGAEKVIETLPLLSGGGRLAGDGESVLIDDGRGQIRRQNIWTNLSDQMWPGYLLDYEPSSNILLTSQGLFHGNQHLFDLPAKSRSAVLGPGGRYLGISWSHRLYLVSGYPVTPALEPDPQALGKLLKLRRLRSKNLIDLQEYLKARERVLQ